jgi:hypothetical protein
VSEQRARRGTVSLPGRSAAGSLVDEMRTAPAVAATSPAAVAPAQPVAVQPAAEVAGESPLPPPRRRARGRDPFTTKLPPPLIEDLRAFTEHHGAEIQVVVELAVGEYLSSRGWRLTQPDGKPRG